MMAKIGTVILGTGTVNSTIIIESGYTGSNLTLLTSKNSMKKKSKLMAATLLAASGMLLSQISHAQTYKWTGMVTQGNSNEYAYDVATDGKGNSYVVGGFEGNPLFDGPLGFVSLTSVGSTDIYLAKYDRSGVLVWVVRGFGTGEDIGKAVAVYPDGAGSVNIFLTGQFSGSVTFESRTGGCGATTTISAPSGNSTDKDMFIAKYNADGCFQWARDCGTTTATQEQYGRDITVNSGGIWVTGYYAGAPTFLGTPSSVTAPAAVGGLDGFLVKYTDGVSGPNANWVKALSSNSNDYGFGVAADASGNSYVTGRYDGTSITFTSALAKLGASDGFIAKYNSAGTAQWGVREGGTSATLGSDLGGGIAVDGSGNVYTTGCYTGAVTFLGTTGSGSSTSIGVNDWYVLKLTSAGAYSWVSTGGSSVYDNPERIEVDNCGTRCYVAGMIGANSTFGAYNVTGYGLKDGLMLELNASTGVVNTGSVIGGSDNDDYLHAIAVNAAEDIVFCGSAKSTYIDYSGGGAQQFNWNSGTYDGFFARWDHSNWPNVSVSLNTGGPYYSSASHTGIGTDNGCSVYQAGNFGGQATFGSLPMLQSTFNATTGFYTRDGYLTRTDKFGDYNLAVRLTNGTAEEYANDLYTRTNGDNYVIGNASVGNNGSNLSVIGGVSYSPGPGNFYAVWFGKWNSAGVLGWSNYAYVTGGTLAQGNGIVADNSGNTYITGSFNGTLNFNGSATTLVSSGQDIYLAKYNSTGVLQWAVKGGGVGTDWGQAVALDNAQTGVYITGGFNGTGTFGALNLIASGGNNDVFVCRYNTSGVIQKGIKWTYSSLGWDIGYDINAQSAADVYVTGSGNMTDCINARFDLNAVTPVLTWQSNMSGGNSVGSNIEMVNGYVYVSGYCNTSTSTIGTFSVTANKAFVISLAGWNGLQTCGTSWAATSCMGLAVENRSNAADHGDNAYVCGNEIAAGSVPMIVKVTAEGCAQSERIANSQQPVVAGKELVRTAVFPNPATDMATIQIAGINDLEASPCSIVIMDMTGRVVMVQENIATSQVQINTSELTNGAYLYQVVRKNTVECNGKMLIQH
jgi:Secretion system C-terminal sorting domain